MVEDIEQSIMDAMSGDWESGTLETKVPKTSGEEKREYEFEDPNELYDIYYDMENPIHAESVVGLELE